MDVEFPIRNDNFADYYETISDIGRGKFALVKRCRHLESNIEYAAKFLRKRRCGKDCRSSILREIDMLRASLTHPRVIDVVEVFETRQEIIIVTEYAAGGELFQHMILEDCFEEKDVIRLMRQIIDGVKFLHNASIVHLDIKPQNILLTETPPSGDIKLCDFGFARHVRKGTDILEIVGTPDYVAPEVLSYEPIQTSCDMWSIGVLTYVMLTGCSPFAADTKQETFLNISQVNLDFPEELYDGISNDAIDFITGLLVKDPRKRMTVHQCAEHKWLSEDKKSCTLTMPTIAASNVAISSPIGCRRALSSSSESAVAQEPVKRQCCIDENDTKNECRLPTAHQPPITQEIEVVATVECSQHTTTPLPNSCPTTISNNSDINERISTSSPNLSFSNQSTCEDIILTNTSVVPSSSTQQTEEGKQELTPVTKSYTVTKEFTIERHTEISLKLEVRSQDSGLVVQRSPHLVRRTDSERQLVC